MVMFTVAPLGVALVPEGRRLFSSLTVEENLLLGAWSGRPGRWNMDTVLDLFPALRARLHHRATALSGGQQQMVAIGRALMSRPRLLVLDEPSMGLAPLVVRDIFEQLRRLNREQGLAILVAEQNSTVALQYADRATVLDVGTTVLGDDASALRRRADIQSLYFGEGARIGMTA